MITAVDQETGRRRVAELVTAAMGWHGLSGTKIERTSPLSRATIDRVKRADPQVADNTLRALGDVLRLPRDFLLYVRDNDEDAVIEAAAHDPDLVRWTLALLRSKPKDPGGPN